MERGGRIAPRLYEDLYFFGCRRVIEKIVFLPEFPPRLEV
jgi:hypothetical protein